MSGKTGPILLVHLVSYERSPAPRESKPQERCPADKYSYADIVGTSFHYIIVAHSAFMYYFSQNSDHPLPLSTRLVYHHFITFAVSFDRFPPFTIIEYVHTCIYPLAYCTLLNSVSRSLKSLTKVIPRWRLIFKPWFSDVGDKDADLLTNWSWSVQRHAKCLWCQFDRGYLFLMFFGIQEAEWFVKSEMSPEHCFYWNIALMLPSSVQNYF